jgi:hypothetical protein
VSIIRGYFYNVVALAKLFSFFIQYNSIFVESFGLSDDWAFLCRETFLAVQSLVLGLSHTGAAESLPNSLALAADSWESGWSSLSLTTSEIV